MKRILIIALLSCLVHCITVGNPERNPAEIPASSGFADWNQVFRQPARIQEFQILHTGEVEVPVEGMLNKESFQSEDPTMFVDVYAFWFCHREQGCFLIDSGLDTSFGKGKPGNVRGLMAKSYIISSRQKPGSDILSQLSKQLQ